MLRIKRLFAQILSLLQEIIKDDKEIKNCLAPATADKAKKYDEQCALLNEIHFTVKSITPVQTSGGSAIKVVYNLEAETILVDDGEGIVQTSPTFKAINKLNLIPVKDMMAIKEQIDKMKEK